MFFSVVFEFLYILKLYLQSEIPHSGGSVF